MKSRFRFQLPRSPGTAAYVVLASALAMTGCAAIRLRLGSRVYLNKIPLTSIEASLPRGPGIAPGEESPLVVSVTEPGGKVLVTEGKGHGKVLWKDLKITGTVVAANKKGIVSLPQDPRISDGKEPHVTITVPSHPGLQAELDIPLRYDRSFWWNGSGSAGLDGADGTNGLDGAGGANGSFDPNNPTAGGDGGDGTNGTDGGNGQPGGDGPPAQVRVALRSGSHPLLQVGVSAEGREMLFLVDPRGGTLAVTSAGGPGGSGGKGGRGGRGGMGGIGGAMPNGRNGSDGSNGRDGLDGSPGRGGSITVTYDPQVRPFLGVILLNNPGGPYPVFREQPVAALW